MNLRVAGIVAGQLYVTTGSSRPACTPWARACRPPAARPGAGGGRPQPVRVRGARP
ncbi:hypothetical protein ACFQX7_09360 [Luedemannella flava]